jgi:hypothetical protein
LLEDDDGEGGEDDHNHLDEEEYIDVTPQEKEAIDRVILFFYYSFSWLI